MLALSFSVLMSLPFLVPHLGYLALVGFVPLLLMDAVADAHGARRFFWWYYGAFVLWNAFTTFWVCNATVGGGIFAVLANAAQMAAIFAVFRFSKRHFSDSLSYVFLAVMWIAWEHFYFDAEISWPWLVLGNSFARSVEAVQWYEFTGTLGGSAWIWASNLLAFSIVRHIISGSWTGLNPKARLASVVGFALVLLLPLAVSIHRYVSYEADDSEKMTVHIAQPDFDPYEKFSSMTQAQQNAVFLDLMKGALKEYSPDGRPVLLISPETFTNDILVGRYWDSPTWNGFLAFLKGYPDANLMFGASTRSITDGDDAPSRLAYQLKDGRWMQTHNSALMMDASGRTQIFHKSKLVVGVELTPYPEVFCKIDDWLGHVMGRCVGQDKVTVLDCCSYDESGNVTSDIPVGSIICYESVYGEYCTEYVKAGARALAVITNDAWWGDTPGYKQHLSYSCLRAIETRRDIARCANTGISAFVDQRGRIVSQTEWWEPATLSGEVSLNDARTFFVENGDVVGRVCTFCFLLSLLLLIVRIVVKKREA